MQLLLVRHAIAHPRSATRWPDDADRPLTPQGKARARKAAEGLKRIALPPALVLASPFTRARQTASILSRFAGWPEATPCRQLLPNAAPNELFALIGRSRERCIAVVGHEPGLSRLIAASLSGGPGPAHFEIRKMGVAQLTFRGAAGAGRGRLVWLLPPKALRAAR